MRTKWSVTCETDLHNKLKELSLMTRIPASKLFDEAIEDLLIKHDFDKLSDEYKQNEELKRKKLKR